MLNHTTCIPHTAHGSNDIETDTTKAHELANVRLTRTKAPRRGFTVFESGCGESQPASLFAATFFTCVSQRRSASRCPRGRMAVACNHRRRARWWSAGSWARGN